MKITARALHDHPVVLEPSPGSRAWPGVAAGLFADPSLQAATARGWDLLCPYAFEAAWNGGDAPEDIRIEPQGFAVSRVGHGVLTFQTGYSFALDAEHDLWLRGPINQLKDGIQPLDQVIEADLLPVIGEAHWRFTRPGQVVRFLRGEPFATLLPYPSGYIARFQGEITPLSGQALPGISCICPTYARVELLEEAIEAFLRQRYAGPKELIVLNDYPAQTLRFEHPAVQIVNLPLRFRSLGEKLNAAVALCAHDLIVLWNDDEISLPHRLALTAERFERRKGFFKAARAFYWNDGAIDSLERNTFHGGSCFARDRFTAVRGYPHGTVGSDQALEAAFARERFEAARPAELSPAETYLLYRWQGTGSYHLSGFPGDGYAAVAGWVEGEARAGRLPEGEVWLQPRWRQDYAALAHSFLAAGGEVAEAIDAPGEARGERDEQPLPPIAFASLPRPVANAERLFRGDAPRRISVVLPACNERRFLQRTFEQFAATLPPRSEIVIVDNGSTDGCADFLAARIDRWHESQAERSGCVAWSEGIAATLVRTPQPLGVAGARNRGLDASCGEVVVFADAHIDPPPGWWPPLLAALNRPGVGMVGPALGVIGEPEYVKMCGQRVLGAKLRQEWLLKEDNEPRPVPALGGGFMAMRRAVLEETGAFDGGMTQWGAEDLEISLRMWLLGHEVWVVPEVEAGHYFRERNPYKVEWRYVLANQLRAVLLHLSGERLARAIHGYMQDAEFPRALALLADSDVYTRRAALFARRSHDDDWFFAHPYFSGMDLDD